MATGQIIQVQVHAESVSVGVVEPVYGYLDRVVPCASDKATCEYLDAAYSAHRLGVVYAGYILTTLLFVYMAVCLWDTTLLCGGPGDSGRVESGPKGSGAEESGPGESGRPGERSGPGESGPGESDPVESGTRESGPVESGGPVSDNDDDGDGTDKSSGLSRAIRRVRRTCVVTCRRYLLPESLWLVFGRTTRYQLTVLGLLVGYVAIWTFVGITYQTWATPVQGVPGAHDTRSSLGFVANRLGTISFMLTIPSVWLACRDSVLSKILGVPHQTFMFLHRWVGHLMLAQAALHSIGWCIVEMNMHQTEPAAKPPWASQNYVLWGIVAMAVFLLLWALTLPFVVRAFGYEFFRISHTCLVGLYMGALILHWGKLDIFIITSLVLMMADKLVRGLSSIALHRRSIKGERSWWFHPADAQVRVFMDPVGNKTVRLDFQRRHKTWHVGQHFYLCFPPEGIWRSHPFSPLNDCEKKNGDDNGLVTHSYIFRARAGETGRVAEIAVANGGRERDSPVRMPVVLTGPWGVDIMNGITPETNILCVAGGTGISYVLPVLLRLARQTMAMTTTTTTTMTTFPPPNNRLIRLFWFVRYREDAEWVQPELDILRAAEASTGIIIHVLVTREYWAGAKESKLRLGNETFAFRGVAAITHPDPPYGVFGVMSDGVDDHHVGHLAETFVGETVRGRTVVFASGPGSMMTCLRSAVARCNRGMRVWRGNERYDVELRCDVRLGG